MRIVQSRTIKKEGKGFPVEVTHDTHFWGNFFGTGVLCVCALWLIKLYGGHFWALSVVGGLWVLWSFVNVFRFKEQWLRKRITAETLNTLLRLHDIARTHDLDLEELPNSEEPYLMTNDQLKRWCFYVSEYLDRQYRERKRQLERGDTVASIDSATR